MKYSAAIERDMKAFYDSPGRVESMRKVSRGT
jgi:hypothetical protein